jgi:hypothetical protein
MANGVAFAAQHSPAARDLQAALDAAEAERTTPAIVQANRKNSIRFAKMNFPRQKLLNKMLSYTAIVILLSGALILLLHNRNNASDISITPSLLSSITPTPYPLPTTAYDLSPFLTIVPETISAADNQSTDSMQIEEDSQQQAENEYIDLYSVNGYLPVDVPWWQQESKQVYEYVSKRLDTVMGEKVIVKFFSPDSRNCPARGRAILEEGAIVIFADENTSEEQILGVLAHELGHLFTFKRYRNLNDQALSEGMATWAAGDYWEKWKGFDFNSGVRNYITNDVYLPLFENYDLEKAYDPNAPDCITHRDILYTEFASFLDYLIQTYGMEQLSALFDVRQPEIINNKNIVYPPNYKDVYGLEFNQLEYEWLKTLLQPSQ